MALCLPSNQNYFEAYYDINWHFSKCPGRNRTVKGDLEEMVFGLSYYEEEIVHC